MSVLRFLLALPVAGLAYVLGSAAWTFLVGLGGGMVAGLGVDVPIVTLLDAAPAVGVFVAILFASKTAGVLG